MMPNLHEEPTHNLIHVYVLSFDFENCGLPDKKQHNNTFITGFLVEILAC